MTTLRQQQGFTLIEMLVVVMIVATVSAMSVLAINQAFGRRYVAEADRLLVWLQQLSENSALQGSAYGVVNDGMKSGSQLTAVIYYRNRWVAVTAPAPFPLSDDAVLEWLVEFDEDERLLPQQQEGSSLDNAGELDEDSLLLPEVAFLPDGYIEPQGTIELSFTGSEETFVYRWGDDDQIYSTLFLDRQSGASQQ
jgi:prepilin-type N-terminal cleavage/methylation domain-containing protein